MRWARAEVGQRDPYMEFWVTCGTKALHNAEPRAALGLQEIHAVTARGTNLFSCIPSRKT